jgi:anaerobic dimethyl sulfoxide reductase subunit B
LKTQFEFYFDSERCIKCKACEVACKQWKGIKAGTISLIKIEEVTTGVFPEVERHFFPVLCRHCAKGPCIEVCPTKAISRLPNGIVVVNQEKCIGCKVCLEACPFGAPQFNEDGLMQKCDMCLDRLEQAQGPFCVSSCPTQVLHWGTVEEMSQFASRKALQKMAQSETSTRGN